MYHIFFIHSFIDGHLGCFYISAIINNAVINMGVGINLDLPLDLIPKKKKAFI